MTGTLRRILAALLGVTPAVAAETEPNENGLSVAYSSVAAAVNGATLPTEPGRFGRFVPPGMREYARLQSERGPQDGGTIGPGPAAWGVVDEAGAVGWYVGGPYPAPPPGVESLSRDDFADARIVTDRLPFAFVPAGEFVFAAAGFGESGQEDPAAGCRRVDLPGLPRDESARPKTASDPFDYDAVDAIAVAVGTGPDSLPDADAAVLRDYALGGGHVLISLDGAYFDDAGTLADLFPFTPAGTSELRSLAEFEQWVDGAKIRFRGRVPAARFASDDGVVLGGTDGPLLLSRRFGIGRVTMFAPDLTAPPLSAWRSRDALLREAALLGRPTLPASLASATADGSLAGQLDRALATFDVVELPRGRVYVGLILLAAVVGPLDYLLVHRLLGRPRWTWATLPLLCVGGWFAVTSVGTASVGEGGDGLRAKSLTLRDEIISEADDPAVPAVVARSRTLFALASPRHGRFDLTMTDAAGPGPLAIGWHAPPGDQFGGRDRPGRLDPAAPEYVVDPAARSVSRWPIPAGGAKMLRVISSMTTPESSSVVADLASPGTRIRGTLTNATDEDWTDCRLVFGGRVYRPNEAGTLAAGQTWSLDADETLSATRTRYLRRAQVVEVDTSRDANAVSRKANIRQRLSETPYDPRGRDLGRIVEVISLYRAAGGPDYTGLTDAGTEGDDFSGHLDEGRAVFLCRVIDPAAPVAVARAETPGAETTVVRRVVVPVASSASFADRDLPDFDDDDG